VESAPVKATIEKTGNASPAMNNIFPGTRNNDTHVATKAWASIYLNSESVSNEI
jgi:hypothetical protein